MHSDGKTNRLSSLKDALFRAEIEPFVEETVDDVVDSGPSKFKREKVRAIHLFKPLFHNSHLLHSTIQMKAF